MLDFTSAVYLGIHHPSGSLRPWARLTTGAPAALVTAAGVRRLERALAALIWCERAIVAPSTLHLFWDLFGMLATSPVAIYFDRGAYPIARWGVERALAQGVRVRSFHHHDPSALRAQLRLDARLELMPLVVADGFCPGCGRALPLAEYLECARMFGGSLILDDTQALGILGAQPSSDFPYGKGGGGSLAWSGAAGPDVLVVSSLAKGFGVPIAVLAGSRQLVQRFEERSLTRVHASPPSAAVIHAAEHALEVNATRGDTLRLRLAALDIVNIWNQEAKTGKHSTISPLRPSTDIGRFLFAD
jgi:8-amino-7-oxononanoate synthase